MDTSIRFEDLPSLGTAFLGCRRLWRPVWFSYVLDKHEEVLVYAKLPPSFTIDTHLGKYNPDWAHVEENNGERRLYFVIETKGGTDGEAEMRPSEKLKTDCAQKHFATLDVGEDFQYKVQTEFQR